MAPRVVVADDRAVPESRRVAVAVADHWQDAGVTMLADHGGGNADALGLRGVEVVPQRDVGAALATMRYQASILIVSATLSAERWSALRASQPQARVVLVAGAEPVREVVVADVSVVLAMPGAALDLPVPIVGVSAVPQPDELEEGLSHAGLAPATDRRINCGWAAAAG